MFCSGAFIAFSSNHSLKDSMQTFEEPHQLGTDLRIVLEIHHLCLRRHRQGVGEPAIEQCGVPDLTLQRFFDALRVYEPRRGRRFSPEQPEEIGTLSVLLAFFERVALAALTNSQLA